MASKSLMPALFFCLLFSITITTHSSKIYRKAKPCKELVFFFHDILFQGHNRNNATAVIVGAPDWGNKTAMATPFNYGDLVIFDDPITLDNNLHSTPVGRAQGIYAYDAQTTYAAWLSFSFFFNSTEHKGSLVFAGADPLLNKTREIAVTGGTGDFFMSRGIAIVSTDAYEGEVYFRLRVDIKLHECWK